MDSSPERVTLQPTFEWSDGRVLLAQVEASFGRYALLKKLAVGGMAEIFLAQRLSFGDFARFVVIKRLLPEHRGVPGYEKLFLKKRASQLRSSTPILSACTILESSMTPTLW